MAGECKRYHSRLAELVAAKREEGRKLCDYYVMDQGKSVLCVAEISITMLERFASYKEGPSRIVGHALTLKSREDLQIFVKTI